MWAKEPNWIINVIHLIFFLFNISSQQQTSGTFEPTWNLWLVKDTHVFMKRLLWGASNHNLSVLAPGPPSMDSSLCWVLCFTSLPMDDPRIRLISTADVVLRQQARQPCGQRGAIHPALTGSALLNRRHEDKISCQQLKLIVILRQIWVHDLQCLRGSDS